MKINSIEPTSRFFKKTIKISAFYINNKISNNKNINSKKLIIEKVIFLLNLTSGLFLK